MIVPTISKLKFLSRKLKNVKKIWFYSYALTYGHKTIVINDRITEMSFGLAQHPLRDRVSSFLKCLGHLFQMTTGYLLLEMFQACLTGWPRRLAHSNEGSWVPISLCIGIINQTRGKGMNLGLKNTTLLMLTCWEGPETILWKTLRTRNVQNDWLFSSEIWVQVILLYNRG